MFDAPKEGMQKRLRVTTGAPRPTHIKLNADYALFKATDG